MSAIRYVSKKAEDLKLGDMFAGWHSIFIDWGDEVPKWPAKRVLDFKAPVNSRGGKLEISLDDGSVLQLHPEMMVLVEVLA